VHTLPGTQPSSLRAFSLEDPREVVIWVTTNSPASSRPSQAGTRSGALAPATFARYGSHSATGAGSSWSGERFGEESPGGAEGALVGEPVIGDAGDRAWHGVLVGEAVHGSAVDDQLPVGPGDRQGSRHGCRAGRG